MAFTVPEELPELLSRWTKEVLRFQPDDINKFSADYFRHLSEGNAKVYLDSLPMPGVINRVIEEELGPLEEIDESKVTVIQSVYRGKRDRERVNALKAERAAEEAEEMKADEAADAGKAAKATEATEEVGEAKEATEENRIAAEKVVDEVLDVVLATETAADAEESAAGKTEETAAEETTVAEEAPAVEEAP